MKKLSKIFIAGKESIYTRGFIDYLKSKGFRNIVTNSDYNIDLVSQDSVHSFFKAEKIDYVFLTSVESGGIVANITYPAQFIYNNLQAQNNVVHYSYKFGVKKLLFMASSCVYPRGCKQPMKEEYLLSAKLEESNEPYAIAKIAGIKMCQAYSKQYNLKTVSLIPATIYGPNDDFDLRKGHVISSLIRKFHEAKIKGDNKVVIWGTGKPRREFLYLDDLTEACIFLMNNYHSSEIINVGYGDDISIRELALLIKNITGFKGKIVFDKSKPDGVLHKLLDKTKIRKLGWRPKIYLEEGILRTYGWYKANSEYIN